MTHIFQTVGRSRTEKSRICEKRLANKPRGEGNPVLSETYPKDRIRMEYDAEKLAEDGAAEKMFFQAFLMKGLGTQRWFQGPLPLRDPSPP